MEACDNESGKQGYLQRLRLLSVAVPHCFRNPLIQEHILAAGLVISYRTLAFCLIAIVKDRAYQSLTIL